MKITVPKDCDNAPKRRIIRDFNLAFAHADLEAIAEYVHQDAVWNMVGDKEVVGRDAIIAYLGTLNYQKATAIELQVIITHGKFASAMGTLSYGKETIAFNDTYEFTSAGSSILKKFTSFAIPLK